MAGTSSNISGVLIGFAVPALFITEYKDGTNYTPEELHAYAKEVTYMLIFVSAVATTSALFVLLFFKEKPPTPSENEPQKKRTQGHSAR